METFKKRISVLLALVLCVNMLQLTAFAEETQTAQERTSDEAPTTTTSWSGNSVDDPEEPSDPEATVADSQTTVVTEAYTTSTSSTETITEITEDTTSSIELAPDTDVEWNENDDWVDEGDEISDGPSDITVPIVNSDITVELTPQEDGSFSGSAELDWLDWKAFMTDLGNKYDIGLSELARENDSSASSDDGNVTVSVSNNGNTVEIVQIEEDDIAPASTGIDNGTLVELTLADIPAGYTAVYADDGKTLTGYTRSEAIPTTDGSTKAKTTTITIIKTAGTGTVIQTRTITTTTIDLSNTSVTLGVNAELGELEVTAVDESTEKYGSIDFEQAEVVTDSNPKLAALAEFGYWGDETSNNLEAVASASSIDGLTAEAANAAMAAVLFDKDLEDLTDSAKAFYDYLMCKINSSVSAPEPEVLTAPTVQGAKVSGINSTEGTANVTLIVSLASSVTGDLLVNIKTDSGEIQATRVRLDSVISNHEDVIVKPLENGIYQITIKNVKLSNDAAPVDVTITTKEIVTERQVYQVTTTIPGTPAAENDVIGKDDPRKPEVESGRLTFDTSRYEEIYVKQANGAVIWVPEGDDRSFDEIINSIRDPSVKNRTDRDQIIIIKGSSPEPAYIRSNGGNGNGNGEITTVYVENGILRVNGSISHLNVYSNGQETPDTETTDYGMMETTTTTTASGSLRLDLTGSLPTATMVTKTQEQQRTGTAAMIQTNTTTRDELKTTRTWTRPGDDDDDDDGDIVIRRDDDDGDDIIITEPEVPLAELPEAGVPIVETPTEESLDEAVPLAEIPDEEVPLAELPDEDVPLADVPKTGDSSAIWYALAALSTSGLLVLSLKKREDEEV